MPDRLFLQILNMSITASFVILAVIAARLLLKKAPHVISYALWAVVLFRLVCPFSFESAISLLPINANPIPQEIVYQKTPQINTGIPMINDSVNVVLPAATPNASMNPMQGIVAISTFLWICGIAALLVYSMISLLMLKRKLRDAICEGGNVYLAEGLASPFVMGLFCPKIYLPANLAEEEKRYILLHERTHIKRFDHVVKIASFAVLCLHWFNPLVWAAFFLSGKDMEMSCDEAVIKCLGSDVKKEYSSSLLTLATGRQIVSGSPLAFGEGDTKSRIKNVLNYKRPAFWVVALAVIAVAVVGVGLAVNPIAERSAMAWAKNLQVESIVSAELVTTYGDENNRYQRYKPEEFASIVKLVNGSRGKYLPQPEFIAGGGMTLYITTSDGMRHSVGNNGNVYLEIDGDSFQMSRFAVDGWGWYRDGNAPVPDDFFEEDADFTAATITEHVNGEDKASVNITDPTEINLIRSLLLIGEFTDLQSTNDVPNKQDYIHISLQMKDELLHYYVYVKYRKYYVEQPYNGIREISADDYASYLEYLPTEPLIAPIVNSYYAGQSSRAFKMLQKSVFQNWVEYDNSGFVNQNLVNPKWNFDSFTKYIVLDANMNPTQSEDLYYCTFSDDNGKSGYIVMAYHGDSMSKTSRVETPYPYDLRANIDNITAKLMEAGIDLPTAEAARVQVLDAKQNNTREAIRITDGNANQYLHYFDEVTIAP